MGIVFEVIFVENWTHVRDGFRLYETQLLYQNWCIYSLSKQGYGELSKLEWHGQANITRPSAWLREKERSVVISKGIDRTKSKTWIQMHQQVSI